MLAHGALKIKVYGLIKYGGDGCPLLFFAYC